VGRTPTSTSSPRPIEATATLAMSTRASVTRWIKAIIGGRA
jgi:hypothetical protein